MRRGETVQEQLDIAREVAAEIGRVERVNGGVVGEVDAVFECTGVMSCVQAGIYVRLFAFPLFRLFSILFP